VKYDSAEGLMNELAARQQNLKHRPTYNATDSEPGSGRGNRVPGRPE
jgi:hypothetical protein